MIKTQLLIRSLGDEHPKLRNFSGLRRYNFKPQRSRVNDNKAIATISGVNHDTPQPRHFYGHSNLISKAGQVAYKYTFSFSIFA